MRTRLDHLPARESRSSPYVPSQQSRTWFPILLGVLCGMIAGVILANVEITPYHCLVAWIYDETGPKELFAKPGYDYVVTAIFVALVAVGGAIGTGFSSWSKGKSFLFLLAILLITAAFALAGICLDYGCLP